MDKDIYKVYLKDLIVTLKEYALEAKSMACNFAQKW
jgi:hypothetical protein